MKSSENLSRNGGSLVVYVICILLIFPVYLSDPLLQFKSRAYLSYKVQLLEEFTNSVILVLIHASFSFFEFHLPFADD